VMGGVRKGKNLFAVYVMKKKKQRKTGEGEGADGADVTRGDKNIVRPSLVVRDENGNWTEEYAKVLEAMSIPPL